LRRDIETATVVPRVHGRTLPRRRRDAAQDSIEEL
jgi:hypothetical protein